jgi:glycosyltransferase involved in cell wall biosynthesis
VKKKNSTQNTTQNRSSESPAISIVIPALNEEKFLPLLLQDLTQQTFKHFEVIVVDGKSADTTLQKARKFSSKIALKTFTINQRNVSHQRNHGAKYAQGKWIIFMDADNELDPDFLSELFPKLLKNDPGVFTCLGNNEGRTGSDRFLTAFINLAAVVASYISPTAGGCFIGIKKEAFPHVSFNPEVKVGEDYCFVTSAIKAGFSFTLFKSPRYTFSLRRFHKDGKLKVLSTYVKAFPSMVTGGKFSFLNVEYPMDEGGKYYS